MLAPDEIRLGDIVELKKPHPCGSNEWEVIRLGADIKVRCRGCGRVVMMPRRIFARRVRQRLLPIESADANTE